MAELNVTEDERKASSYLEWDEGSLGRLVKRIATMIEERNNGKRAVAISAAATLLCCETAEINTASIQMQFPDLATRQGRPIGSFVITVERTKTPEREREADEDEDDEAPSPGEMLP